MLELMGQPRWMVTGREIAHWPAEVQGVPRGDELHPLKEVFLCPALATSGSAPVSNLLIFPLKDPKYPCAFGFTAEALVVYLGLGPGQVDRGYLLCECSD